MISMRNNSINLDYEYRLSKVVRTKQFQSFINRNVQGLVSYKMVSESQYDITHAILDDKLIKFALKIIPLWNVEAYTFYTSVRTEYTPTVVYYDTLDIGYVIITKWINGKHPQVVLRSKEKWRNIGVSYAKFQKSVGRVSFGHKLDKTSLHEQCYAVSNYMGHLKYCDYTKDFDVSFIKFVDHGDLNIYNILIDSNDKIFFLDYSATINESSLCGLCILKNFIHINSKNLEMAETIWMDFLVPYLNELDFSNVEYFDKLVDLSSISIAYTYILAETKYSLDRGALSNQITYWSERYQNIVENTAVP